MNCKILNRVSLRGDHDGIFRAHPLICLFVFLLYLGLITISWDRASGRYFGNTFRLTQVFFLLCFVIWIVSKVANKQFSLRNSGLVEFPLLLFILWSIGTDVTSYNLKRSISYSIWMVYSYMMVLMVVDYVGESKERLRQTLRVYFLSFVIVSVIGLIMLVLEVAGFDVATNPGTGRAVERAHPRLYGLNYEPSYFATYSIIYLVVVIYLKAWGKQVCSDLRCKRWHFYIVLIAFVAAASRGGFVIFIPFLFFMLVVELYHAGRNRRWFVSKWAFKIVTFMMIFVLFGAYVYLGKGQFVEDADVYLFTGMGVGKRHGVQSAHSLGGRGVETAMTIHTGIYNPIMGVGMGGYGRYVVENLQNYPLKELWLAMNVGDAIAEMHKTFEIDKKDPEPMCVSAEVFATTGIPGLILWLIVNFLIPFRMYRLAMKQGVDKKMCVLLKAMALGHIWLFLIMHFNQNIMRPYYWLNIAMCCAIYLVARSSSRSLNEVVQKAAFGSHLSSNSIDNRIK